MYEGFVGVNCNTGRSKKKSEKRKRAIDTEIKLPLCGTLKRDKLLLLFLSYCYGLSTCLNSKYKF